MTNINCLFGAPTWNNCTSILFKSKCVVNTRTRFGKNCSKSQLIGVLGCRCAAVREPEWKLRNESNWWQQQKFTERKICDLKFISIYQPISYIAFQKHLLTVSLSIHLSPFYRPENIMQLPFSCGKVDLALILYRSYAHKFWSNRCPHSNQLKSWKYQHWMYNEHGNEMCLIYLDWTIVNIQRIGRDYAPIHPTSV